MLLCEKRSGRAFAGIDIMSGGVSEDAANAWVCESWACELRGGRNEGTEQKETVLRLNEGFLVDR